MDSDKLLTNLREYIKDKNLTDAQNDFDKKELLEEYVIPNLSTYKDIQGELFKKMDMPEGGIVRNVKNKVINKLSNVSKNTVERSVAKQQQFNNAVFLILEYLLEENKKLTKEINSIKKDK